MIVVFKGIKARNVLVFDAEYNEGDLIQFSGILFRKIGEDIFQIEKSTNLYIKLDKGQKLNSFIINFTGITDNYLNTYGEKLEDIQEKIRTFINVQGTLMVVSHGVHNDRQILWSNGIDLYNKPNGEEIQGFCTYNAARKLLNREKKLKLTDVAQDAGMFVCNTHNSFDDAWATISVFCLITKLQEEKKNEKIF